MCEICVKLTIKTPKRRQWRPSSVFIVNFEQVNVSWVWFAFQNLSVIFEQVITSVEKLFFQCKSI